MHELTRKSSYDKLFLVRAGVAQLVEHDLAKVGVEGSSPFSRFFNPGCSLAW